jgi:hypothetical protein
MLARHSNSTVERDSHREKHSSQIVRTDAGMQIEPNDMQAQNARSPSFERLKPGANVTLVRRKQEWKHDLPIVVSDEGKEIDSIGQEANALSPRVESLEPDSKAKARRARHSQKHSFKIVSTDEGIRIP